MSNAMSSGVSTSLSPAWVQSGERNSAGGLDAQARRSSGEIAAYLNQNGIDSIDPNQLFAMANDTQGCVPKEVQQAAGFMLSNPDIYARIETSDRVGDDGVSSVRNFEQAAQGHIALAPRQAPNDPATAHACEALPSETLQAENASGALGHYMQCNGMGSIDPNQLYALSRNRGGNVPAEVQDAAGFMLKNPSVYRAIETSDVAGADGVSSAANFDKAARGGTLRPGAGAPMQVGRVGTRPSNTATTAAIAKWVKMLVRMLQAASQGASTGASTPPLHASLKQRAQTAAGTLATYMHATGMQSVDLGQLRTIAGTPGGSVPTQVRQAADFMLKHPTVYRHIETDDVAGADGLSGAWNFDKAARGEIAFR